MSQATEIRENMRVVGSCGNYVGTVERVEGDEIVLAPSHPKAGYQNHWVPLAWVESVNGVIRLDRDSDQAHRDWRPSAVLGG